MELSLIGVGFGTIVSLGVIILILWSVFWKGWALWVASKENSKLWFFFLLIVNTFGILEIIYIFAFSKDRKENSPYKGIFSKKRVAKEESTKEVKTEKNDEKNSSVDENPQEPNA